jgi:hypothetical protein
MSHFSKEYREDAIASSHEEKAADSGGLQKFKERYALDDAKVSSSSSSSSSSLPSPKKEEPDSKIMRVVRNCEQAELLFMNELKLSKSEVLIASSSLSYLKRLDGLGLLDFLEQAKSRGLTY